VAHAYTPGLRVAEHTVIRRDRRLPLKGEVLVEKGARVRATDPVARTLIPGNVQTVNVVNQLGCDPIDVPKALAVAIGSSVAKGEVIARRKGMFGLGESKVISPASGVIESVSDVTGQVILREPPLPIEVDAYIDGVVTAVREGEGVTIETPAAFVQGIFGIGGETYGELVMGVESPSETLDERHIKPEFQNKVVVGGSLFTASAFKRAREVGVRGVIAGGFHDKDLKDILGYDLGVAITGA